MFLLEIPARFRGDFNNRYKRKLPFCSPPCPVRQLCLRRRRGVRGAAARGLGLECPERRRGVEQQGRRRTRKRPLALASRPAPFRANSGSWCWLACARGRRVERKLYNFFASNANPCRGHRICPFLRRVCGKFKWVFPARGRLKRSFRPSVLRRNTSARGHLFLSSDNFLPARLRGNPIMRENPCQKNL